MSLLRSVVFPEFDLPTIDITGGIIRLSLYIDRKVFSTLRE
ncbi:hypothetical protein GMMP15_850032 [Candidatus Magnetomoraceae bacterium gMMP-15]